MQPLFQYNSPIKYNWHELKSDFSLKNSCVFGDYIFATDMILGGTRILNRSGDYLLPHMHCFPGWSMMWNPYPVLINGQLWVYVCDTGGGSLTDWWNHMRIYRYTVDLVQKQVGPLIPVNVFEDTCGLIDPCLVQFGELWYLFYAKLWDPADNQWWDPHYSVSTSPEGPFTGEYHLGIVDHAGVVGIDEAFKVATTMDRRLIYTASHGDSGTTGFATIGEITAIAQDVDGHLELKAIEQYRL